MADETLPDDALVVHGGLNQPEQFETGSGVTVDSRGKLHGVSVNSAAGKSVAELSRTIPHGQVGVTTVGAVRAAGGDVVPARRTWNPGHCHLSSIDAETAGRLFTPTIENPGSPQRR